MLNKKFKELELFQFQNLSRFDEICHYVTGRNASGYQNPFNLSYKVGGVEEVSKNRALLANSLQILPQYLMFPDQTHSTNVKVIHDCASSLDDTDAIITAVPGIGVNVMSADCVPILLFDPIKKVVAAIHAGWRGTVGQIVTKTLEAMRDNFSCSPPDIVASIGPSICKEAYEVGEEVITAVRDAFPGFYEKVVSHQNGKAHFDLWQANFLQLTQMGVLEDSIEIASICTFSRNEDFFSVRREGLSTGRFAAGILLKQ